MQIETLDHVALWVADRDRLADFLTTHAGCTSIDRTERFTLRRLGRAARQADALRGGGAARPRRPRPRGPARLRPGGGARGAAARPSQSSASTDAPSSRPARVSGSPSSRSAKGVAYDLDHVAFRVPGPEATFARLAELGFEVEDGRLSAGRRLDPPRAGRPWRERRPAPQPPRPARRVGRATTSRRRSGAASRSPTSSTRRTHTRSSSGGPTASSSSTSSTSRRSP